VPAKSDESDAPTGPPRRTGSISYQDPETTTPREPTLAEQRARQLAARREEEAEAARWDEMARKAKQRKRMLIGGAATVGVVAVVAIAYSSASSNDVVQARCTDQNNVVVDDSNCVQPAGNENQYHSGGLGGALIPIFIGGGGRQYHYTYGGTGDIGQVATGGTTVPPKDATVRTPSGKTISTGSSAGSSSVKRGGFGVHDSTGRSGGS
jgi:hypothetical protein